MNIFTESGIQFTFPDPWRVIKYDDHRFYKYLSGLGLKGVDFIGITDKGKLLLVEVKNFKDRFPNDEVNPTEVLVSDPAPFSQNIVRKFEDSIRLIHIIHQYLQRKWAFRWIVQPLLGLFPFLVRSRSDWGFWAFAHQSLEKENVDLVLWLELGPSNSVLQPTDFKQYVKKAGRQAFPNLTVRICHNQANPYNIVTIFI